MENIIQKELAQNAKKFLEEGSNFSPSYQQKRVEALEYFNQHGIPNKKHENWLYTNIAKSLAPRFIKTSEDRSAENDYIIDNKALLIFNNGFFNRSMSQIPAEAIKTSPVIPQNFHDAFDALNMIVANDAITFKFEKNTIITSPITILHLVDEKGVNKQITPRINILVEPNCELTFVEVFTSIQNNLYQYTTNASTHFHVGNNSKVKHVKLNLDAQMSTHISLTHAEISRDAQFETYGIDLGNLLTRNNIEVHLNAENATAGVHGLFNLKQSEHADVFSSIHHHAPHTFSSQLYKGILNNTSHGAFTGKVVIDQDAIGVDAAQLNKNLLLSKKAHINTRPQLVVSADDVKCAHGATVGELSKEEEFYLTSRGISKDQAKKMLALGFAHEILYKINDQKVFNFINKFLVKADFTI